MRIIGLTGPARAGKDTAAGFVAELFDGDVIRQGFADKLKLSAARIFDPGIGLEDAIAWCNALKTEGGVAVSFEGSKSDARVTGREFLQNFGTESHRDVFGEDFWLDGVLPLAQDRFGAICGRNDCDLLVIPDVRFENEAARVRFCGGEVWHVERPDAEEIEKHASEAGIEFLSGTGVSRLTPGDGHDDRGLLNDYDLTTLRGRVRDLL